MGGLEHALTPLAAGSPHIHVLDRPTRYLSALWLPYRRRPEELRAAIAEAGPVDAIFAHADVVSLKSRASRIAWDACLEKLASMGLSCLCPQAGVLSGAMIVASVRFVRIPMAVDLLHHSSKCATAL